MRFIDVCARRGTEALHAIVTGSKEECGQDVDNEMQARGPALGPATLALVDAERTGAVVFILSIRKNQSSSGKNNVDNCDSRRAQRTQYHASDPAVVWLSGKLFERGIFTLSGVCWSAWCFARETLDDLKN